MVTSLDVRRSGGALCNACSAFLSREIISALLLNNGKVKDIPFKVGTDIKHFSNVNISRKHDCILVRFDQNGP